MRYVLILAWSPLASVEAMAHSVVKKQGERNYIMQVVCEATQSPSSEVQVAAFECLVKIMHLYYDWMKFYMERALFGVRLGSLSRQFLA